MLAICSNCEKPIVVDAPGWNGCKYCQRTVWIPDPMNPDAAVPSSPAPPPAAEPVRTPDSPAVTRVPAPAEGPALEIPWEQSHPGQLVHRFFSTLGVVLFRSRRAFAGLADTPRAVHLMAYGTVVLTIGLFTYFQVQAFSFAVLEAAVRSGGSVPTPGPWVTEMLQSMKSAKMDARFFLLSSALSPLMAWILIACTHQLFNVWYFLLTRRKPVPVHRLQRLVCYSYTPWLFIALPLVGLFWFLIVQYRALRQGLQVSRAAALLLITVNLLIINLLMQLWIMIHAALLA
jgi:hypothetical protein